MVKEYSITNRRRPFKVSNEQKHIAFKYNRKKRVIDPSLKALNQHETYLFIKMISKQTPNDIFEEKQAFLQCCRLVFNEKMTLQCCRSVF